MSISRAEITAQFAESFPDLYSTWSNGLSDDQIAAITMAHEHERSLCIMPTGSGKSIVYWLSAMLAGGTAIVVSPLIALIDEQASKLTAVGHEVMVLHSGISQKKRIEMLSAFADGRATPRFLFASPERMATDGLFEAAVFRRRDNIGIVVVDEIHCVSQWGADFRPFYRRIPAFLDSVFGSTGSSLLGLTATINGKDLNEICSDFRIGRDSVYRSRLAMRTEIRLRVIDAGNEERKEVKLWELLEVHRGEKTLVYLYRKYFKRSVEWFTEQATQRGRIAVAFHGDMSAQQRQDVIKQVQSESGIIIFATNAFGMGIDIPDIRVVIHFMIPESTEQYYQEVGRAARDGRPANAYLLFTTKNVDVRKTHFIDRSFPSVETLQQTLSKMVGDQTQPRSMKYFDDEEVQKAFSYLIDNGALNVICKGFSSLKPLRTSKDEGVTKLLAATLTGNAVSTALATGLPLTSLFDCLNNAILDGRLAIEGSLDNCLFVKSESPTIGSDVLGRLQDDIETKRSYKHRLLDYLSGLAASFVGSESLHQEIALYLGVDKREVGKVHKTKRGEMVRSKSEVIIANLLHDSGLDYEYEKKLYYAAGSWKEPDFTIVVNDVAYYWEHLGLLGAEDYDQSWIEKRNMYEREFPGRLILTHESGMISGEAMEQIDRLRSMMHAT